MVLVRYCVVHKRACGLVGAGLFPNSTAEYSAWFCKACGI